MLWQEQFGDNIRRARIDRGLSLIDASNLLGYGGEGLALGSIEDGCNENVELSEIVFMAHVYDVEIASFFDGVKAASKFDTDIDTQANEQN